MRSALPCALFRARLPQPPPAHPALQSHQRQRRRHPAGAHYLAAQLVQQRLLAETLRLLQRHPLKALGDVRGGGETNRRAVSLEGDALQPPTRSDGRVHLDIVAALGVPARLVDVSVRQRPAVARMLVMLDEKRDDLLSIAAHALLAFPPARGTCRS